MPTHARVAVEPAAEIYCRIDAMLNALRQMIEVKQRVIRTLADMSPSDSSNRFANGLSEKFYAISVQNAMLEKIASYPECWDEAVEPDTEERFQMRAQIEHELREIFRATV